MKFVGIILPVASKNILISSKCLLVVIAFTWFVDETQVGMCACNGKTVTLRQNKATFPLPKYYFFLNYVLYFLKGFSMNLLLSKSVLFQPIPSAGVQVMAFEWYSHSCKQAPEVSSKWGQMKRIRWAS